MHYTTTQAHISYIYHKHTDANGTVRNGDYLASTTGGCFRNAVYGQGTQITVKCYHDCYYSESTGEGSYKHYYHPHGYYDYNGVRHYDCNLGVSNAPTSINGNPDGGKWDHPFTVGYQSGPLKGYSCSCGKSTSTIESATILFK